MPIPRYYYFHSYFCSFQIQHANLWMNHYLASVEIAALHHRLSSEINLVFRYRRHLVHKSYCERVWVCFLDSRNFSWIRCYLQTTLVILNSSLCLRDNFYFIWVYLYYLDALELLMVFLLNYLQKIHDFLDWFNNSKVNSSHE